MNLNNFMTKIGFTYPLTFSWSSQSNDVVERKNHSIFNIDRRILKSKRMYKELWVYSIFCAVSLSNQCPIKSCWWMFSRHIFCKLDSIEPDHFVGPIHVFILFFKHDTNPCNILGKLRECGLEDMGRFLLDLLHEPNPCVLPSELRTYLML